MQDPGEHSKQRQSRCYPFHHTKAAVGKNERALRPSHSGRAQWFRGEQKTSAAFHTGLEVVHKTQASSDDVGIIKLVVVVFSGAIGSF